MSEETLEDRFARSSADDLDWDHLEQPISRKEAIILLTAVAKSINGVLGALLEMEARDPEAVRAKIRAATETADDLKDRLLASVLPKVE